MDKNNDYEMDSKRPLIQKGGSYKHQKLYGPQSGPPGQEANSRLAQRQKYSDRKRNVNDVVTLLALLGIVVAIVTAELHINKVIRRGSTIELLLLIVITVSTIILEVLLLWYHYLDLQFYMNTHRLNDWRLVVDNTWIFRIAFEVVICAIHPVPGLSNLNLVVPTYLGDQENKDGYLRVVGDILTIAMFLRLYLVFRVIVLHSTFGKDLAVQSLTAYNHININFWFVFKSVLNSHPGLTLSCIVLSGILIMSWFLRLCENGTPDDAGEFTFPNCLWMICITFLTIGYGDITPATPSGRAIAILLGLFGVGCTALLIGLVAQKLELSRNEKFLHNFVTDTTLGKDFRSRASDIVKFTWLLHLSKRKGNHKQELRYRKKLLNASEEWRAIKRAREDLTNDTASIEAIYKEQTSNSKQMLELKKNRQTEMDEISAMKKKIAALNEKLDIIHALLVNIAEDRGEREAIEV